MTERKRPTQAEYVVLTPDSPYDEAKSRERRAAVLSDEEIEYQMSIGNIVIFPYHPDQLQSSSYDLRLGEYFYREHRPEPGVTLYSPWSEDDVRRVWGEPQQAVLASERFSREPLPGGVFPDDRVILMPPKSRILGHTQEFIGGRKEITTSMQARSSMGRNAITVCECAGWGDVGYINRWTMEITNNFEDQTVVLVVGRRIAQMIFQRTGPTRQTYSLKGKYQTYPDLDSLVAHWKPEDMLPKMWKDREIQPGYEPPQPVVIRRESPFSERVIERYDRVYGDDMWLLLDQESLEVYWNSNECVDYQELLARCSDEIRNRPLRYVKMGALRRSLKQDIRS